MDAFLKKLAEAIVAALLARFGIEPDDKLTLDDLLTKGAIALKVELADDLGKIDAVPAAVAGLLGGQIAGIPDKFRAVINQMLRALPFPFNGVQI
jgi:hypothetical protein